jgi:hypothetical protein
LTCRIGRSRGFLLGIHLLYLLLALGSGMNPAHAQPKVNLTISGELTESQQRNIRNFLSLSRLQDNAPLSLPVLNRLYGKAEQEAATALEPFGYPPPHHPLQTTKNGTR